MNPGSYQSCECYNDPMFLEKLEKAAAGPCRLEKGRLTLVGLSGGADSLALLDGLHSLGYRLAAAHFDHGLRQESGEDAASAGRMAAERGIPFMVEKGNVRSQAETEHLSIEEAARKARYRFLFQMAHNLGAQSVAVGHTADDQAETVLMHFLRGSGLAGLRGMQARAMLPEWDPELPLVRPALHAWRAETVEYCAQKGLHPLCDSTNEETTYYRNRLRLEVLPYLEGIHPGIKKNLLQLAEIAAGDEFVLEQSTQAAWNTVHGMGGLGTGGITMQAFLALPAGMQRRLARMAISRLVPGLRDIDFETTERFRAFAGATRSGDLELAAGVHMLKESGSLYVYHDDAELPAAAGPQLMTAAPQTLAVPGSLELDGGTRIMAELVEPAPDLAAIQSTPANEAWLDASLVASKLIIRGIEEGDRFQPLGLEAGSIKIGDFYTNHKIPLRARPLWPLVFSHTTCVWVACQQIAHTARVTTDTRQAVHLSID